jgi:catechol 2,3-dioxygenase
MTSPIDPSLRIQRVGLAVSDLARSADFYERILGLGAIERRRDKAPLGAAGADPALELIALADPVGVPPGSTGLFHVAWLHPTRAALADTVRRVAGAGWPIEGTADHGVSEALYLSDPDGLGIEIYVDRPRDQWSRPADGRGVNMVTLPLDLEDLLAQSPDPPTAMVETGTGIGHVHLKVADVARAAGFYTGLGFEQQALLPSAAFVSAGGYHHHLGMNSWQSADGRAAPLNAPGLREVAFELGDQRAVDDLAASSVAHGAESVTLDDGGLALSDPDGHALRFSSRRAD